MFQVCKVDPSSVFNSCVTYIAQLFIKDTEFINKIINFTEDDSLKSLIKKLHESSQKNDI